MNITEKTYLEALDLLRKNATEFGFIAADKSVAADKMGYRAVLARDAMLAALAALTSDDNKLIMAGRQSLVVLAKSASTQGQIPMKFDPATGQRDYGFPINLDASVWWLIVYWLYIEKNNDTELRVKYYSLFQDVIKFLQNHLQYGLLEQGEGADWANELPRSGFSLYTNSLWLIFVHLIKSENRDVITDNFNYFFTRQLINYKNYSELNRQLKNVRSNLDKKSGKTNSFLAAVSSYTVDTSVDVWGNILACLTGAANDKKIQSIIKELKEISRLSPVPMRVLAQPERFDQSLKTEVNRNKAWQFQNAGCWLLVGGWWVYLLAKNNNIKIAQTELQRLAEGSAQHDWEFNEWFHGRTGKPMGIWRMSHTAASYIIAYKAVVDKKFIV